jgi:hypothetical protein
VPHITHRDPDLPGARDTVSDRLALILFVSHCAELAGQRADRSTRGATTAAAEPVRRGNRARATASLPSSSSGSEVVGRPVNGSGGDGEPPKAERRQLAGHLGRADRDRSPVQRRLDQRQTKTLPRRGQHHHAAARVGAGHAHLVRQPSPHRHPPNPWGTRMSRTPVTSGDRRAHAGGEPVVGAGGGDPGQLPLGPGEQRTTHPRRLAGHINTGCGAVLALMNLPPDVELGQSRPSSAREADCCLPPLHRPRLGSPKPAALARASRRPPLDLPETTTRPPIYPTADPRAGTPDAPREPHLELLSPATVMGPL